MISNDIINRFSPFVFFQQFDSVITAVKEGKEVDLSKMPQIPTGIEYQGFSSERKLLLVILFALEFHLRHLNKGPENPVCISLLLTLILSNTSFKSISIIHNTTSSSRATTRPAHFSAQTTRTNAQRQCNRCSFDCPGGS